jgi:hypothetical protein
VKSDRSVGLIDMGTPFSDEPTAMKDLLSDNIKISQTVKNAKTDIILTEKLTSVDISIGDIDTRVSSIETSTTDLTPRIDSLESDNTSNKQDIQDLTDITNLHTQALNVQTDKITALEDTSLSKVTGLMDTSYTISTINNAKNVITKEYLDNLNTISGYLKKDRSVILTGTGTFNTKQIASMDDLKDSNIIVTDEVRVITTLKDKLTEMDTIIQSQANLITQLQQKTDTVRVFPRRFLKTTGLPTNLTIGGNQAKRILDEVTIQNVIGYDATTFTLTGTTNKIIKELIIPPFTTKLLNIRISLSHNVSMGNTQIQPTLWRVRNDEIATPTIVAGGTVIYNNDNDARIVTTMINSIVVNGDSDPFVKYGYYIELKNLEPTALNYSSIDIFYSEIILFLKWSLLEMIVLWLKVKMKKTYVSSNLFLVKNYTKKLFL